MQPERDECHQGNTPPDRRGIRAKSLSRDCTAFQYPVRLCTLSGRSIRRRGRSRVQFFRSWLLPRRQQRSSSLCYLAPAGKAARVQSRTISRASVRPQSRVCDFDPDPAPLAVAVVAARDISDGVLIPQCLANAGGRRRNLRPAPDDEAHPAGLGGELIEKKKSRAFLPSVRWVWYTAPRY